MANENSRAAIEATGALVAQLISRFKSGSARGDAETILKALEQEAGGLGPREFNQQLGDIQTTRPESALQLIEPEAETIEPGFLDRILGGNQGTIPLGAGFEQAERDIGNIFPGSDVASRFARADFGERIQRLRTTSAIDAIRPQLADAFGVDQSALSPESLDILMKTVTALPSPSTASPLGAPVELVDAASGKSVVAQKEHATGKMIIDPDFKPKKRDPKIPQLTLDFTEEGTLSGITHGPADEVKFGPGERARRSAIGAEAGKVQVLKPIVISAVEQLARLDELIPEGTVRGLSAQGLAGIESAFTQMGALFGGDPKVLTAKFPKRLKDAPEIGARVKSGIVNLLALRLQVRGQKPSVRGVEAELRNLDSLSGGNPDAVFAQLQEIAREMIVTFNNRAANAGVDPVGAAELPSAGRLGIQFPEALDAGGTTVQPGTGAEGGGLRARRGPDGEVILLNSTELEAFDNKGTIPPRFLGGEGGR